MKVRAISIMLSFMLILEPISMVKGYAYSADNSEVIANNNFNKTKGAKLSLVKKEDLDKKTEGRISGQARYIEGAVNIKKDKNMSYLDFTDNSGNIITTIEFDPSTNRIEAFSGVSSGNYKANRMTFKLLSSDGKINQKVVNMEDTSMNFVTEINSLKYTTLNDFQYIYVNFNQSSGVSNLKLVTNGNTTPINMSSSGVYFQINNGQLSIYQPNIKLNPINLESNSKSMVVSGTADPSKDITITYGDNTYNTTTQSDGKFSYTINSGSGFVDKSDVSVSYSNNIPVIESITVKDVEQIVNPVFGMKNVWGGTVIKLVFDLENHKIKANICGNYIDEASGNQFVFEIFKPDGTKEYTFTQKQWSIGPFGWSVNGKEIEEGDIIGFTNYMDLKAWMKIDAKTYNLNSYNGRYYFKIENNQMAPYDPEISVNPMILRGNGSVDNMVVSGTTYPNVTVNVKVGNNIFTTTSGGDGSFSVDAKYPDGYTTGTIVQVEAKGLIKVFKPQLSTDSNINVTTHSGYSYTLNKDESTITEPFPSDIIYLYSQLSDNAKKAWDQAYPQILNPPIDSYIHQKDGEYYQEIMFKDNLKLTRNDLLKLNLFMVRGDPRTFQLKDWVIAPIYGKGIQKNDIIGCKFYVGNGSYTASEYYKNLMTTEKSVSNILSKINSNMDIYQIIWTVQKYFERSISYYYDGGNSECILGDFRDHRAVCGGYAKGFEYLMLRLGIPTIWIAGYANKNGTGYHAWNEVNIYGKWYLADTTWGGPTWYLTGYSNSHAAWRKINVSTTAFNPPKMQQQALSYKVGLMNNDIVNNMGIVSFVDNNDGTFTINYNDTKRLNKKVQLNPSYNNYQPLDMTNNNGNWGITINKSDIPDDKFDFYFTTNEFYGTAGDVSVNNLKVVIKPYGMHNIEVTINKQAQPSETGNNPKVTPSQTGNNPQVTPSQTGNNPQVKPSETGNNPKVTHGKVEGSKETTPSKSNVNRNKINITNSSKKINKQINTTPTETVPNTVIPNTSDSTIRISGDNRFDTDIDVVNRIYPNGADTVLIVNSNKYSDILSAVPYSTINKAPILYVDYQKTPSKIIENIKTLKSKKIVIIGGEDTVSLSQERDLKNLGYRVYRISGENRIDTSLLIAKDITADKKSLDKVVIASANNYADALSISPFASKSNIPILLSEKDSLAESIIDFIKFKGVKEIYVAGGTSSISDNVIKQLENEKIKVVRLSGNNRYQTSVKINEVLFKDIETIVVASGQKYEDALVGAMLTKPQNASILLVEENNIPRSVKNYLSKNNIGNKIVVGGEKSVSNKTAIELNNL